MEGITMAPRVTGLQPVISNDPNGGLMIGIRRPEWIDAVVLVANVAQVYTIPTGATRLLFSADNDFYANYGAAGAVPSIAVTDGSASEMNPELREISGVTTVGLISPYATKLTICAYK